MTSEKVSNQLLVSQENTFYTTKKRLLCHPQPFGLLYPNKRLLYPKKKAHLRRYNQRGRTDGTNDTQSDPSQKKIKLRRIQESPSQPTASNFWLPRHAALQCARFHTNQTPYEKIRHNFARRGSCVLTTTSIGQQICTFEGPGIQTLPKCHETPREGGKNEHFGRRGEKKSEILGGPGEERSGGYEGGKNVEHAHKMLNTPKIVETPKCC